METPKPAAEQAEAPPPKKPASPLRVRTNLRAGASDRLFDSQNNANGFWDEEDD